MYNPAYRTLHIFIVFSTRRKWRIRADYFLKKEVLNICISIQNQADFFYKLI